MESLFKAMTPEERLTLLSGTIIDGDFCTRPIPRLGVPSLVLVDASQGVRGGVPGHASTDGKATLFTSGVLLAATWDVGLARRIGGGVGTEAINKGRGAQILLGPGVNIIRSPLCGRNGEYFSEDPCVAARMGVAYIEGLQSTGCAACVKHYACNNQEFERGSIDVHVDERALRELYTPAFIAAVREARVWAVMSSYNKVNGAHSSANWYLQKEILKKENGFEGIIMTDWGGLHSTLAINSGCDLEMPGGGAMMPGPVNAALQRGALGQDDVDDAVRRVLRTVIRVGLMDGPKTPDPSQINSPGHQQLALQAAEEGMVLLKNERHLLPIDPAKIHSIALIGPACKDWQMGTGGSAGVDPPQSVSAYEGIVERAGSGITISYDRGCDENETGGAVPSSVLTPSSGEGPGLTGEYFNGFDFSSTPKITRVDRTLGLDFKQASIRPEGIAAQNFCARWTGTLTAPTRGTYRMNVDADRGARLYLDDKLVQDTWPGFDGSAIAGRVDLVAGQTYKVRLEFVHRDGDGHLDWQWITPGEDTFGHTAEVARKADLAVVFVGSGGEGEGADRRTMALPGEQNDLIRAVVAANPNTVVILNNGGPVLVSDWVDQVPGVLEAFFPAEYGGKALAELLFGDQNPSGKLTYTIAKKREDYPDFRNYPVQSRTFDLTRGPDGDVVDYKEGIYVGYRSFDKKNVGPSFPFGFGLSYTTFQYANMKLSMPTLRPSDQTTVTADITNTGSRAGAEVVELYMRAKKPRVDRPIRELKDFSRVELQPGQTQAVSFTVTPRDLAYCDVPGKQWKADAGAYRIELGSSSRDLRAGADLTLSADYAEAVPGMGGQPHL